MPESYSREITQEVAKQSIFMMAARRLQDISRNQHRMPVVSQLPQAYWVNGDTGLKKTTEMLWGNVFLNVEELAVIVPIPEAVLDDADYDIWAEVKPALVEALGQKVDNAALFDIEAPASWPTGLVTQCVTKSHSVDLSTVVAGNGDIYDAILGESGVFALVEADGYGVTGSVAPLTTKAKLRGLRSSEGDLIFKESVQSKSPYTLDGTPMYFIENSGNQDVVLLCGDWTKAVWAMRQDITYKVLTEAVIQDSNGDIIYNLAQQDMVALRVVMRLAWAHPNPPNRVNEDNATRFPFAALVP